MAELCDASGRVLLYLTVECDTTPCVSTVEKHASNQIVHFKAHNSGQFAIQVANVGIHPACFFTILREENGVQRRVNNYRQINFNEREVIDR